MKSPVSLSPDNFNEGISMSNQNDRPWWKHRWPWLLMSGPALAVAACAVTIWMAFNVSVDVALHDGVEQHGLKVTDHSQK
jgi:hypothetical protein